MDENDPVVLLEAVEAFRMNEVPAYAIKAAKRVVALADRGMADCIQRGMAHLQMAIVYRIERRYPEALDQIVLAADNLQSEPPHVKSIVQREYSRILKALLRADESRDADLAANASISIAAQMVDHFGPLPEAPPAEEANS